MWRFGAPSRCMVDGLDLSLYLYIYSPLYLWMGHDMVAWHGMA
jgi:hypothetical protein